MTVAAYPLRTEPLFRDYLWGGRKLQSHLGKTLPPEGVWAESWEVIDHPEHHSVVTNGPWAGKSLREIMLQAPGWLLGGRIPGSSLPLLLKYLDCQQVLSVQVHPDDAYASRMSPPDLGKTEAWYIVDAEPGAVLYAGLKSGVTREMLRDAMREGDVESCLHPIHPQPGDCVFIPAGTVHALGAGLLVAEIQQASNTTFRLFDWNRTDASGKPRELHQERALEVIDFHSGPRNLQSPSPTDQVGRQRLVGCEKFLFDRLWGVESLELVGDERFHLLTAPGGGVELLDHHGSSTRLDVGESVIIPATTQSFTAQFASQAILLDMYLP